MNTVIIIGMGPRGLTLLERLLEHVRKPGGAQPLHIHVVDPGGRGEGAHPADQPDHLLVNTVASQITMFAPSSVAGDGPGLTLTEWARQAGYRRHEGRFQRVEGCAGEDISDADHLPRSLLGEYLGWVFRQVVRKLPAHVTLRQHRSAALDIEEDSQGAFLVKLADGHALRGDFVFLATGHGRRAPTAWDAEVERFVDEQQTRNQKLAYVRSPYPIRRLDDLRADATVAIQGFGLTSHDVVSALTVGRGGRFEQDAAGALRYQPSGEEPRLLLVSRSCLPFAARGVNQKGLTGRHQARFFTAQAVRSIRERSLARGAGPRIDFEAEVLPLVLKEMAYAWRCTAQACAVDADSFEPSPQEMQAISDILWPLRGRAFRDAAQFRAFFLNAVRKDLAEADMGNLTSPAKAATDVLRDTREALRAAVEFAGLTPQSHRLFLEEFNAITNRVSFGPPRRRNRELLALVDAGVLDLAGGPGARIRCDAGSAKFVVDTDYLDEHQSVRADVLVSARLDTFSPLTDDAPLYAAALRRGLLRPFFNGDYHPGGLDIDRQARVLRADGTPHLNMWAVGFPVEGAHFYTHALPRPAIASRQTADAEACILQMLDRIADAARHRESQQALAEVVA